MFVQFGGRIVASIAKLFLPLEYRMIRGTNQVEQW